MNEDVHSNIRARVERFRYLATMINDEKVAAILRQMAEEGEADLRRLEAEQVGRPLDRRVPATPISAEARVPTRRHYWIRCGGR